MTDTERTMRHLRQAWGQCTPGSAAEQTAEQQIDTFYDSAEWQAHLAERKIEHNQLFVDRMLATYA